MSAGRAARVVLVVEDDWLVRSLIADEFKRLGWHVLEAAEGECALETLVANHVDVLFTDIQLAGQLSGWDVAEALRASRPDASVVYTSGNAADKSRQVTGSLFFDKPYDPDAVINACTGTLANP